METVEWIIYAIVVVILINYFSEVLVDIFLWFLIFIAIGLIGLCLLFADILNLRSL